MNEFGAKTKYLFNDVRYCMLCDRVDMPLEDNHIYGRISKSPINMIRVCKDCHAFMDCFNQETGIKGRKHRIAQVRKTLLYLIGEKKYQFTTYDKIFMERIADDLQELLKESII